MTTQTRPGGTALDVWPALSYAEWKGTCATLHIRTQIIVGKVKLALTPFLNEWWNVAFHLTARGLTTGLIPYQDRAFEVRFERERWSVSLVDMWIAYSVGDGPYGVAPATAAMLSLAGVEAICVDRARLGRGWARGSRRSPRRARGRYESAPGPPP